MKNLVLQIALGAFIGVLGALFVMDVWHSYKGAGSSGGAAIDTAVQSGAARESPARQVAEPQQPAGAAITNSPPADAGADDDDDLPDEDPATMEDDLDEAVEDDSEAQ